MQVKGSKVKDHTLLKRNPKGRLHQDLCKTKELQWVKLIPSMESHQSSRNSHPAHGSTRRPSCSPQARWIARCLLQQALLRPRPPRLWRSSPTSSSFFLPFCLFVFEPPCRMVSTSLSISILLHQFLIRQNVFSELGIKTSTAHVLALCCTKHAVQLQRWQVTFSRSEPKWLPIQLLDHLFAG